MEKTEKSVYAFLKPWECHHNNSAPAFSVCARYGIEGHGSVENPTKRARLHFTFNCIADEFSLGGSTLAAVRSYDVQGSSFTILLHNPTLASEGLTVGVYMRARQTPNDTSKAVTRTLDQSARLLYCMILIMTEHNKCLFQG
jgi:hypothetical protein